MKKIVTYVVMLTYLTAALRPAYAEQQDYCTELEEASTAVPQEEESGAPCMAESQQQCQQPVPAVLSPQSGGIPPVAVYVSERQEREDSLALRQGVEAREKKVRIIFNIVGILAVVGLLIWANAADRKSS
ncbi:MAG: hypothetical protein FWB94_05865 [Chitinispirillia bacterium]|nr:hypothetical protein [Chitinispirillia bacterium]